MTQQTKVDKIYDYYMANPSESLRSIGCKHQTSHAQVKRVLERKGVYPRYKANKGNDYEDISGVSFFKNITLNIKHFNKTELIFADLHIPYHEPNIIASVLEYTKSMHPDYVVYLGDVIDFYQISSWNKNPEEFNVDHELYQGRQFLTESKDYFGDAIHYYIEGNHEKRLKSFLFSKAPQLSSLRALQLGAPDMLDLDALDIEYIQTREWMLTYDEPFRIGKLYHLHGHELMGSGSVVHIARNTLLKTLDNILIGHHHRVQNHIEHGIGKEKLVGAWSVGCMCNLHPDFMPINNWMHGFAEVHYADDGRFQVINHSIYKQDGEILIF